MRCAYLRKETYRDVLWKRSKVDGTVHLSYVYVLCKLICKNKAILETELQYDNVMKYVLKNLRYWFVKNVLKARYKTIVIRSRIL